MLTCLNNSTCRQTVTRTICLHPILSCLYVIEQINDTLNCFSKADQQESLPISSLCTFAWLLLKDSNTNRQTELSKHLKHFKRLILKFLGRNHFLHGAFEDFVPSDNCPLKLISLLTDCFLCVYILLIVVNVCEWLLFVHHYFLVDSTCRRKEQLCCIPQPSKILANVQ